MTPEQQIALLRDALVLAASFAYLDGRPPCYCDEPDHVLNGRTKMIGQHREWCVRIRAVLAATEPSVTPDKTPANAESNGHEDLGGE